MLNQVLIPVSILAVWPWWSIYLPLIRLLKTAGGSIHSIPRCRGRFSLRWKLFASKLGTWKDLPNSLLLLDPLIYHDMKYTVHIYALYYCRYLYIYTDRMILPSHPVTQGDSCDGSPLAATIETWPKSHWDLGHFFAWVCSAIGALPHWCPVWE